MSLNIAQGNMIDTIWDDLSQHKTSAGTFVCFGFMYTHTEPSKHAGRTLSLL